MGFLEVGMGRQTPSLGKSGKTDPYLFIKQAQEHLLPFIPSGNHFQNSRFIPDFTPAPFQLL